MPRTIQIADKIKIDTPISIAQFIKKRSGKIFIISSSSELKTQLVFPGKNIKWKTVKVNSKSIAAKPPIIRGNSIAKTPE